MLLDLFWTFAKVGVMTFGGGYAMLPILQREVVEKKGWATEDELADYFAIGQCTPGIIAVNTATFVGQKNGGIPGGILATLGVVFPSLVIITLLASVIQTFAELAVVKHAFAGIRICVCVLIFNAVLKLGRKAVVDKPAAVIAVLVTLLAVSLLRHEENVHLFGRRIEQDVIRRACAIVVVYMALATGATLVICAMQPELALRDVLIEVFSAVNTVGMSTGITRVLSPFSRLVIILLMYAGRLGSLTFALLLTHRTQSAKVQYPTGRLLVG